MQFPTGGENGNVQARERLPGWIGQGQQTWCDSRADGIPVILLDDFDRENEADLIAATDRLTVETMAL